jgi:hypothetical protein
LQAPESACDLVVEDAEKTILVDIDGGLNAAVGDPQWPALRVEVVPSCEGAGEFGRVDATRLFERNRRRVGAEDGVRVAAEGG